MNVEANLKARAYALICECRWQEAETACQSWLNQHPDDADVLRWMGIIADRSGRTQQAFKQNRHESKLQTNKVHMLMHQGFELMQSGQPAAAERYFLRALKVQPDNPQIHTHLAVISSSLGNWRQCETYARLAIQRLPHNTQAHVKLGQALMRLGRMEEALRHAREANTLEPENISALNQLGTILAANGDIEAAADRWREVLQLDPENPSAFGSLCELARELRGEVPQLNLKRIKARFEAGGYNNPRISARVGFALARLADDEDESNEAFALVTRANENQKRWYARLNQPFDQQSTEEFVNQMIEVFDAAYFERVRHLGHESQRPVFVVGMPRSGTTLVEQILASHPKIAGAGERREMSESMDLMTKEIGTSAPFPACMKEINGEVILRLAERYLEMLDTIDASALRVVDKMPANFFTLGTIGTLFPNARVIHCRRDPIDTCVSCYFSNFGSIPWSCDLDDIGFIYRCHERLMKHWRSVLPMSTCEIIYESMVVDTESRSRELISFCSLDWDNRCLDFFKSGSAVTTSSRFQVRKPIYQTSVSRWKKYDRHLGLLKSVLAGV